MVLDRGSSLVEPSPLPLLRATRDRSSTDATPIDIHEETKSVIDSGDEEANRYQVNALCDEGFGFLDREALYRTLSPTMADRYKNYPKIADYKSGRGLERYYPALKHFKPARRSKKGTPAISTIDKAGFFSFLTFSWIWPYIKLAYERGLESEDLPVCPPADTCDLNSQRLLHLWEEELRSKGEEKASLGKVMWLFCRTRVLITMATFILSLSLGFLGPTIFMRQLLEYAERPDADWRDGLLWAVLLVVCEVGRVLTFAIIWGVNYRTGVRLRSAVLALLYKKLMKLPNLGDKSIGEIVNLFSNDGVRIFEVVCYASLIVGGPFVAIVGTVYIYLILGTHALLGMLTFALFYPIQYGISRLTGHLRKLSVKSTDSRVRLMNEVLTSIKMIKMYAWEKIFSGNLKDVRKEERNWLEKSAYVQSLSLALAPTVPIISVIVTFLAHIAAGNNLTASQAFSVVNMSIQLRRMAYMLQDGLQSAMVIKATFSRCQSVLMMPEMKKNDRLPRKSGVAVSVINGSFSHGHQASSSAPGLKNGSDKQETIPLYQNGLASHDSVLSNINFEVPLGSLVGICGPVGSGKSSILSAILGQLKQQSGEIGIRGSVAYVPQQAWIMNSTIKENITFGEKFDNLRYYRTTQCCSLLRDLDILPAGDSTEIGERGVNLSGGQKQRVALARAVYSNRDIYLLDDAFSALDAHVSKQVFEECIKSELKEKTVILVTHQLKFLSQCDKVLVMKDGEIVDFGSHDELLSRCEYYINLLELLSSQIENESVPAAAEIEKVIPELPNPKGKYQGSPTTSDKVTTGRITVDEKKEEGTIPGSVYNAYIQNAGGYFVSAFVVLFLAVSVLSTAASSWWLSYWIKQGSGSNSTDNAVNSTEAVYSFNATEVAENVTEVSDGGISANPDLAFYQTVYGLFILIILGTSLVRGFLFTKITLRASSVVHKKLVAKIFRAPLRFFESTPIGRLLNLFSRDMDEIDVRLPYTLEAFLQNVILIAISIIFPVMIFPWFTLVLVGLIVVFFLVTRYFRAAIRDLKRIENIGRSPIYGHVATSVGGLPSIHAFCKEKEFTEKFMILHDENSNCFFMYNCALRWLAVRLDLITVGLLAATAALVLISHGQTDAAYAGLALAYAAQLGGMLQYTVRLAAETESRFTSMQRLQNTTESLESEAPSITDKRPPKNWPDRGEIEFMEVRLRYRVNLPLALNRVSFKVGSMEKVGIVGRTGSGKSSLIAALFRLVEVEAGTIRIDNVNIKDFGLEDVRKKIAVIPQDPVLFIGTIRYNLDPYGSQPDHRIWEVLELTSMKEKIHGMPDGLGTMVSEDGQNFSVGERQLICMARALLKDSKILVLDEATASIDAQTDAVVQETLRKAFGQCTLLTIAHRLDTVKTCDKILVMEDGKVVEFDTPATLMNNPDSAFYKLSSAFNTNSVP